MVEATLGRCGTYTRTHTHTHTRWSEQPGALDVSQLWSVCVCVVTHTHTHTHTHRYPYLADKVDGIDKKSFEFWDLLYNLDDPNAPCAT